MIRKASFFGNPFIGLFSSVNDSFALIPLEDDGRFSAVLQETLGVEPIRTNIADAPLAGVYVAMNNAGVVLPNLVMEKEVAILKEHLDIVHVSKPPFNAWGNNLAFNTKGGIINPDLKEEGQVIADVFGIEIVPMKVANYKVVGSAVLTTEKGFVATHRASPEEIKDIESILKVKGTVSTVNMGSPLPSIGALANSSGLVAGETTTGIELARLAEGLDVE